jgi:hypothetical protein
MKSQFGLTCILRSAFLISQLTLNVFVSAEPKVLINSTAIEERAIAIAENINKTAIAILSISSEEQTFENTLRPWNRLSAQLAQDFDALDALSNPDFSDSVTASQASDQLHAHLLEVTQNPEFNQILMNCSLNAAHNTELDPFQRYIGARFVNNGSDEPVYLLGTAEEQSSSEIDYSVLNLRSGPLAEDQVSDLARKILAENPDAVCIQEVAADDEAYILYEALQKNYTHFVYAPPSPILRLSRNDRKSGTLIASKFGADALEILLARSHRDRSDDRGEASIGGGIRGSWGDGNGIQWEGYARVEAHDGKGNYAEAEVTQKDDGTGNIDIRGGHESENK